ncbi:MAG: hypothetical protein DSM107014_02690 [Gomphosphaeria aponina SAG 52.96 = DSM 107014]|uniref:Uncharacterized protein n=1 Tax=Gomphosphaeria aponina SAG 52.96 = DSM 107014 TaxID=1521640 RepID=A0A941GTR0_9CHRO|nr:hypothetical protein [Gomphosphaeria aponina SAG 52.96 = DSM 107014]
MSGKKSKNNSSSYRLDPSVYKFENSHVNINDIYIENHSLDDCKEQETKTNIEKPSFFSSLFSKRNETNITTTQKCLDNNQENEKNIENQDYRDDNLSGEINQEEELSKPETDRLLESENEGEEELSEAETDSLLEPENEGESESSTIEMDNDEGGESLDFEL